MKNIHQADRRRHLRQCTAMYDKTEDPSGLRTAFRDAEKRYQLQLRQSIRLRFGSGRSGQVSWLISATRCINHVHLTHQVRIKHS